MPENTTKISLAIQGVIDPVYRDYSKRILYLHEHLKDYIDGLDIGFFPYQVDEILKVFDSNEVIKSLKSYKVNSLHVAANKRKKANSDWADKFITIANSLFEKGIINSVSVHLDMIELFDSIRSQAVDGLIISWEMLGSDAVAGNTVEEVEIAINKYPQWGMVLDVAHVIEMESSGQPGVGEYLKRFNNKINQIHFSYPDNLYSEDLVGPNFVTSHSMVNLSTTKAHLLIKQIHNFNVDIITIEGVIPPGDNGLNLVKEEVNLIKQNLTK